MAMMRSQGLRALAERMAHALPPVVEEVVLTGSVSRGVDDELSDIEMLLVTAVQLRLDECFEHARALGLEQLDTWGLQGTLSSKVFGYLDGVPIELIWWSREHAEASFETAADAIVNGVALRSSGLLEKWQAHLADYPDELAAQRIEEAALTWGGYAPAGMLTVARPGERMALVERMIDDLSRVMRILYAVNRVWPPTHKRLGARAELLAVKPERLAERVEEVLTEPDPIRALTVMTELQREAVALAPSGPNVDRARRWLAEVAQVLRATSAERP
jgi:predicted nucleotidyltransferase